MPDPNNRSLDIDCGTWGRVYLSARTTWRTTMVVIVKGGRMPSGETISFLGREQMRRVRDFLNVHLGEDDKA